MKLTANPALGFFHVWVGSSWAKLVRVMRFTTIIILAACLQSSANGLAQNTVTFSGKDVNLESVFTAIKKQTSYRFFFNTTIIQNASKVTIEVKNAPIEQVLNLALKDQSLTFAIKGRTIFVMKKPEEDKSSQVAPPTGDPVTVSGRVTDDKGQALVGANVKVKGSQNGVTTDNQGRFTLSNVDQSASLEISFVGHETQILSVKGKNFLTVALGKKIGSLDETVVIAYGTTTKRFNTGNITSVKSSDIERQPVSNPILALQGRVPGLFITQTNGLSGGGVTVRIQGRNSIGFGNDPFYVIDGVPFFAQLPSTGPDDILGTSGGLVGTNSSGNPLNYINPSDIESIEVLKDADATAIYGSRAANGAILITTKKGKQGQMKLDLNMQKGWGKVAHKWKMLNTEQYLEMRNEAFTNDNKTPNPSSDYDLLLWDQNRYTDWQKVLIGGTAGYSNYNATISGGNANLQYLISGTYHRETTVFPGDFNDQKGNIHFNINNKSANQKFQMQFSGSYMQDVNKLLSTDLTDWAVKLEPNAPELYNSEGTLNWAPDATGKSTWVNPLSSLYNKYRNETNSLVSNLLLTYQIIPGLNIKSSGGYTRLNTTDFKGSPMISVKPELRPSSTRAAEYGSRVLNSWIFEPQVSYDKSISKGKLQVLTGGTVQQNNSNSGSISGSGFNSDDILENINAAPKIVSNGKYITQYKYWAVFGRLNYNWLDRYIVNLTGRRDGTSRFGAENRFHNFGSLGLAWIFSSEKYIERFKILSFGKLRASYGTTGSDQIPDYRFMSLYNFLSTTGLPYQNSIGTASTGLSNPFLQWEETRKLQAGIELGFLSNAIMLNVVYGRNRSSNQLLEYSLPTVTGFTSIYRNFPATVQNTTWEFTINTTNIQRKSFKWTSSINFTIPKNKLIAFPDLASSTYASTLIIGQPLGFKRDYPFAGVDETTGVYQFKDSSGNTTTTPAFPRDATSFINLQPTFYGGMQNNIKFLGLELDFLFQFVKQMGANNSFMNGNRWPGAFNAGYSNQPITVLDRWQKIGQSASIAKYSTTKSYTTGDYKYIDASYVRLKNVSLSYAIPDKLCKASHIRDFRIYMQGQNLFTITNWQGLDPEAQSIKTLPPLRVWTLGVILGF